MKLLADENFDGRVVRAILRKRPDFDMVRVIDVGLSGATDPEVLEWAASNCRLVVTHDVTTMVGFAYQRVEANLPMPGLIEVPTRLPTKVVVDDLLMLADASLADEWEGQVIYLPL